MGSAIGVLYCFGRTSICYATIGCIGGLENESAFAGLLRLQTLGSRLYIHMCRYTYIVYLLNFRGDLQVVKLHSYSCRGIVFSTCSSSLQEIVATIKEQEGAEGFLISALAHLRRERLAEDHGNFWGVTLRPWVTTVVGQMFKF